jgi:hypothetical protein
MAAPSAPGVAKVGMRDGDGDGDGDGEVDEHEGLSPPPALPPRPALSPSLLATNYLHAARATFSFSDGDAELETEPDGYGGSVSVLRASPGRGGIGTGGPPSPRSVIRMLPSAATAASNTGGGASALATSSSRPGGGAGAAGGASVTVTVHRLLRPYDSVGALENGGGGETETETDPLEVSTEEAAFLEARARDR